MKSELDVMHSKIVTLLHDGNIDEIVSMINPDKADPENIGRKIEAFLHMKPICQKDNMEISKTIPNTQKAQSEKTD